MWFNENETTDKVKCVEVRTSLHSCGDIQLCAEEYRATNYMTCHNMKLYAEMKIGSKQG